MSEFDLKIEWTGLKELQQEFDNMSRRFKAIMLDEMDKIGLSCENYAKALSPRDSGALENSINSTMATMEGRSFVVYVV